MRLAALLLLAAAAWGQIQFRVPPSGQVQTVTLNAWPRRTIISQDIVTRLQDPDGAGPLKAAAYDSAAAVGVRSYMATRRNGSDLNWSDALPRLSAHAALMGFMCEQCVTPWNAGVTWKQYAVSMLTNLYEWSRKPEFGNSFQVTDTCSTTLNMECVSDYGGPMGQYVAIAYSLARNWMTVEQRQAVAQRVLNGINEYEPCAIPAQIRPGTVSVSGNTITLSGSTWHSDVQPGAWIMIRLYRWTGGGAVVRPVAQNTSGDSSYQGWPTTVTTVNSPTQITVYGGVPGMAEGYYLTYNPTHGANDCGMMPVRSQHGNLPPYAWMQSWIGVSESLPAINPPFDEGGTTATYTLTAPMSGELLSLPDPTPERPWFLKIGDYLNAEFAEVVGMPGGRNGLTVQIRRGRYMHGRAWNGPLAMKVWTKTHLDDIGSEVLNNREITRSVSYIALALAFAGDDSRADELLAKAGDYAFTGWQLNQRGITFHNYSLQGYGYGRGVAFWLPQMFYLQNSIASPTVDYGLNTLPVTEQMRSYFYHTTPWIKEEWVEDGAGFGDMDCQASTSSQQNCGGILWWQWLLNGDTTLSRQLWHYFRNVSNYYSRYLASPNWSNGNMYQENDIPLLDILAERDSRFVSADYTATLPSSRVVLKPADTSQGNGGAKVLDSRTDWSSASTIVSYRAIGLSDKLSGEKGLTALAIGRSGGWLLNGGGFLGRNSGAHQGNKHVNFGPYSRLAYANYEERKWPSIGQVGTGYGYIATDIKGKWVPSGQGDLHGLTNGRVVEHTLHIHPDTVITFDEASKSVSETATYKTYFSNDGQPGTNCGVNNANGCAIEKNFRSYAEGNTTIDLANRKVVTSSLGGQGMGAASRMISTYLPSGGNTIAQEADFGVAFVGNGQDPSDGTFHVGTNCSVSTPCRIRVGATTYEWTAKIGTVAVNYTAGRCGGCGGYVWVWFDTNDQTFKAAVSWGTYLPPTCTGSISCQASSLELNALPAGNIMLGYQKYSYSGTYPAFACGFDMANSGDPRYYEHLCGGTMGGGSAMGYDSVKPLMVKLAASTTPALWMAHKLTSNLSDETPLATTELAVTGGNHRALQAGTGSETVLAVLPLDAPNSAATSLSLTSTQGPAKLFVAGLQEGTYTVTHSGGSPSATVGEGETAIFLENIPTGAISVTRTGAAQLAVTTASLPAGTVGQQYSACLQATGGTAPYTWASIGDALPGWASFANGCITGMPNAAATTSHQFRVTDAAAQTANSSVLTLVVNGVTPLQIGPCPSNAVQNQSYSFTLTASNGVAPYTFSHTGTLPTGLTRSGATISGTPTTVGNSSVTFTVTDSVSAQHSRACTMTVSAAAPTLNITTTTLAGGTEGVTYSQTVLATGVTGTPAWDISAGSLPPGLTLNASTGAISGTPTTAGTFNFTIRITDNITNDTQVLTIVIAAAAAPVVASWQGGSVVWGSSTSQTVCTATGGTGPYTYAVTGLPNGLSVSSAGVLTGTTTVQPGTYNVTCTTTDASLVSAQVQGTVVVQTTGSGLTLDVVEAFNTGAMIRVGRQGQAAGATCRVFYSISGGQVNSTSVTLPTARQVVPLEPLAPGTTYSATAVCGAVTSNPVTFTTPNLAGTANVTLTWQAPAWYAVASVDVEVAEGNGAFGAPANTACTANLCEVTLSNLNRGASYRVRRTYRSSGGAALGNTQVQRIQVR